jgi:exonuclease III
MDNFIVQIWNVGYADVDKQRRENNFDEGFLNVKKGIYLYQEISDKISNYDKNIFRNNTSVKYENGEMKVDKQPYGTAILWTNEFEFIEINEPSYLGPYIKNNFNGNELLGQRSTPFVTLKYKDMFIIAISLHCYVPNKRSENKRKIMLRSIMDDSLRIRQMTENKYQKKVMVIIGGDFNTIPQSIEPMFFSKINYIEKNDLHFVASSKQRKYTITAKNKLTGFQGRLDYIITSNNINHSHEFISEIDLEKDFDHSLIKIIVIPDLPSTLF